MVYYIEDVENIAQNHLDDPIIEKILSVISDNIEASTNCCMLVVGLAWIMKLSTPTFSDASSIVVPTKDQNLNVKNDYLKASSTIDR